MKASDIKVKSKNYPKAAFPNCKAWRHNRKKDIGLDGYGCWEALDVRIENGCRKVYAKKSRPNSLFEEDSIVLTPENINPKILVDTSFPKTTTNTSNPTAGASEGVLHEIRQKMIDSKIHFASMPIENKFLSMTEQCPRVFTGDFKRFIRKKHRKRPFQDWLIKTSEGKLDNESFLNHFDPTCFGPGKKQLSDLLQEGYRSLQQDMFDDQRSMGPGCLAYREMSRDANGNLGLLILAQGVCFDELSMKVICAESDSLHANGFRGNTRGECDFEIQACGEIAQSLNGRILDVDATSILKDTIAISAISNHHALITNFHSDSVVFDWEKREARFSEHSLCHTSVLNTTGASPFSSVTLSPYMEGECVVATVNGPAGLWRTDKYSSSDISEAVLQLNVTVDGDPVNLKHVSFAAHPRQFYGCNHDAAYLFDIRSQNSPVCLLNSRNSPFFAKPQRIHTALSCKAIGNEYEIMLATGNHICVLDQRYGHQPLLKWDAISNFPASYLKLVQSSIQCQKKNNGIDHSYSNSVVLTGGKSTHEVYYHQLNRYQDVSNGYQCYNSPPCLIAPPRILNSSSSSAMPRDLNMKLRDRVSSHDADKVLILGFDGTVLGQEDSESICIFQLDCNGKISYQMLNQRQSDAYTFQEDINKYDTQIDDVHSTAVTHSDTSDSNSKNFEPMTFQAIKHLVEDIDCDDDETACLICQSEHVMFEHAVCKHRSLREDGTVEYNVDENYFHDQCTGSDLVLKLIDLQQSGEQSDLGKLLLRSWDN